MPTDIRFRLTKGQRLRIDRMRRGETQPEAAKRWKVPHKRYRYWEDDRYTEKVPVVEIGTLKEQERCILLRVEAGMLQREVARGIGVSRQYLNQMEAGKVSCKRLIKYWRDNAAK